MLILSLLGIGFVMLLTVVIGNVEKAVVTERVDAAVEMEWRGMCVSMLIAITRIWRAALHQGLSAIPSTH